ncbi:aquaporin SIP2-1-like protein [Carex littledalei]|uniref:Aquaporin SIP2-1-like protein n=1 Tax=Carex littledalei TaxID=544730 RepID=A0A833QH09_9POAL|nr:aquaporin SIP2-1-like protein [Carex littledalei]
MGRARVVVADLVLSFLWVWAGALVRLFVYRTVAPGHEAELLKVALSIGYMFFFAWLDKLTGGGSYNPLTVLIYTVAGNGGYLFAAFCRIPAQMLGSVAGVWLLKEAFPKVGHGPRVNGGIHHGALVEGLATFAVVMVSLILKHKEVNSFFMKTWISSISKMTLHILSSDLTGGIMNPASAFGWAFARGDHISLEHVLVYWVAPIQAALFGVWGVKQFTKPKSTGAQKSEETKSTEAQNSDETKSKSD